MCVSAYLPVCLGKEEGKLGEGVGGGEANTPGLRAAKSYLLPREQSALASPPPCTQSLCVVPVTLLRWLSELRPEDPASQRGERRGEGWEPSLTRVRQGELPFSHLCPLSSPSESQLLELGSRWGRPAQTSHESVFEIVLDLFCI